MHIYAHIQALLSNNAPSLKFVDSPLTSQYNVMGVSVFYE